MPEDKERTGLTARLLTAAGLAHDSYEAADTVTQISKAVYHYSSTCNSKAGSATRCSLKIDRLEPIHAEFDPNTSWAIPAAETSALLQHEQGHFDIAALYATRLHAQIDAALAARAGVIQLGEVSNSQAQQTVTNQIDSLVAQVRDEVMRQFSEQEDLYDAETQHGTNQVAQRRWTARLAGQASSST